MSEGRVTRRRLLQLAGAGAAGVVLPASLSGCGDGGSGQRSAGRVLPSKAELPRPFRTALRIPPVLRPSHSDQHADYYDIVQRVADARILPGLRTPVWGYNGIFPGPTLHSRSGRLTVVRHRNELPVPTVVHLHGGRTPQESDGYPTDYLLPVAGWPRSNLRDPGRVHHGVFEYRYPLVQPAATLWYHDHRMDFTGPSVWRGLAGFHLVHDDLERKLPLPRAERDVPLMITDRSFATDGTLQYPSRDPSLTHTPGVTEEYMGGVLGDCILVNGKPWPVLEVAAARYRFRILNASNARRYRLTLAPTPDGPSFTQVGTGQGLLPRPVSLDALDIAQAERFDVVIDFSGYPVGSKVTVRNEAGEDRTTDVMQFHIVRTALDHSRIPERLVDAPSLRASDVVATRKFTFRRGGADVHGTELWTINHEPFDPGRVDARVRRGTTEHWIIEAHNLPHPFHIHEVPFHVIAADGSDGPGPYGPGWKDVVNLDSGGRAELLIRFDGYPGTYVFHCHNLEHEDMMMMANFEIV